MLQKQSMLEQVQLVINISGHLKEKQVALVAQFLMAFNLFEARLFDVEKRVKENLDSIINSVINEGLFNRYEYNDIIQFWINRYVRNGETTGYFRNLGIRNKDDKERHSRTLIALHLNQEVDDRSILDCLLAIAYRFRNNLFHGNKPIETISTYNECYREIIIFVMDLLKKLIARDSVVLKTR